MHDSLDEFKFRPDTDTNTRVICPCASEKLLYNVVTTLAPSFLIGSSSFLQVSRTCMKAWMSSNFSKFATELRPLIDIRIKFLLNILKTYRSIKTKFCIHIIIDKIDVVIVNHFLSQICNRVTAFD